MANLVECPLCSKQISSEARTCPGCGHPFRLPQYAMHEVVTRGSVSAQGKDALDSMVAEGWQITDVNDHDTWVDDEGYHCRLYKFKLIRV